QFLPSCDSAQIRKQFSLQLRAFFYLRLYCFFHGGVNREWYEGDVNVYNRRNDPVTAFYYATYYSIFGKRNDTKEMGVVDFAF
ncbi:MAG: hypothetical protein QW762_03640, partial [Candidatus Thermoplasmatota archaeon]